MFSKDPQVKENGKGEDEPPDNEKDEEKSIEESEEVFSAGGNDKKESEEFWEPFPEYNSEELDDMLEDKDYRDRFADASWRNKKDLKKKEEKLEEVLKKYKEREYRDRIL